MKTASLLVLVLLCVLLPMAGVAQESPKLGKPVVKEMPPPTAKDLETKVDLNEFLSATAPEIDPTSSSDRVTYGAPRSTRGTSIPIPESAVIEYCSDFDGCYLRLGMYGWDDRYDIAWTGGLFFYNKYNRNWRADWWGNIAIREGQNKNGINEQILQGWTCYFTDGAFLNWIDQGDKDLEFGLVSWSEYTADCYLTIVD